MKSKTIALAAAVVAATLAVGSVSAQTTLPSIAGPKPGTGTTLTHANGYSITAPADWITATNVDGVDFMMGNADLSIVCSTFSAKDVGLTATDEQIRVALSTEDLGPELFTKLLFDGAPELAYESTGPQADHPSGWPFQRAVATVKIENVKNTAHAYLTFKANSVFAGFCYTATDKLAAGKSAMDGVINSIKINK